MYAIYVSREGTNVTDEDWDTLIILDACRYDMYDELTTIPGNVNATNSVGSNTNEFLRRTFSEDTFADTVYVAGNVDPGARANAEFHNILHLWDECWDENLQTVHPEDVASRAIQAAAEFPNKRLVIHFLQPHYPFLGEQGQEFHKVHGHKRGRKADNVWVQLAEGEVDRDTVKEAYWENLEVTLPYVENIIDAVEGKTVITSDHGNALGEQGLYGHAYPGIFTRSLRKVPWHVIERGERREVADDDILESDSFSDGAVEDRLEQLGYIDR